MDEPLVVFDRGRLKALDPMTGAVRWNTQLPDCGRAYGRMAIAEGVVVVAAFEWLYCCDVATGAPLWRVATRKGPIVGLLVRDGRVFLYKNGLVECFDGRGQRLWSHEDENQHAASMGFSGDVCWTPDLS